MTADTVTLREWSTVSPDTHEQLGGRSFDDFPSARPVIEQLNRGRLLKITELRSGLEIRTFSHVGRVRIGDLSITVQPKVPGATLLGLLRYAYGYRNMKLVSETRLLVDSAGIEDLLVVQLNLEVREMISRGLSRSYVPATERLASPRGRIDLSQIARDAGTVTATLPCQHHPRVEDTPLNQVLLAGLHFAASMATTVELRRESRGLAAMLDEAVSQVRLNAATLDHATRKLSRLTIAYRPALSIIRLLLESQGVVIDGQPSATALPGFLFDMNAFFQRLLSRFLRVNLPRDTIRDEFGLKGMLTYTPDHNPQRRTSPTPRPDFAVLENGRVVSLLDAKYRDLWEKSLPREMLYQLVMYAISLPKRPVATILYPTDSPLAKESRITVSDPVFDGHLGEVHLRPVRLVELEALVHLQTFKARQERERFARWMIGADSL